MNNIYNTISDIDIRTGETKRMNCPACNGYKTFTVTNNMGSLIWNCYKASCDAKGALSELLCSIKPCTNIIH